MSTRNLYNRRHFMQLSAFTAAAAAIPGLAWSNTGRIKSAPTPGFNPDVEIEFTTRNAHIQVLKNGPTTNVQKYYARLLKGPENTLIPLRGNYLGPILNYEKGQKVRIYFHNRLNEPSIIHWHGLHVPQKSDGHPMYSIAPGERFVYEFEVMNRAGTSFYHSHTHELTAEQVYQGLAGMITVTDDEEKKLELPDGEFNMPLVIQDRSFSSRNQLRYVHGMHGKMLGFLGDTILVNGQPNVTFNVKSRAYRFRALNGSNSRIYKLGWDDGTPLTAIGTDAGLLEKPETRPYIMLAPGERVDLWLDFSGRPVGSELVLYSLPFRGAMPPMYERMRKGGGMMRGGMGMMGSRLAQGEKFVITRFNVTENVSDSPRLPKKLVNFQRFTENDVDNAHHPIPIGISMKPMAPQLNGKSFSLDRIMNFEKVPVGSIKKIKIFHDHGMKKDEHEAEGGKMAMRGGMGGMGMMGGGMMLSMAHPIHLHGQQYQVISRKMEGMRKAEYDTVKDGFIDTGWKDTVLVMPGEEIEIIKPFQDYKGLFLYHCHNLEHEDLGMMRQFLVS
ncbi:multicopper oxidase family protein [methane-oxidizing endosymbiont of Gigantopelta aegis]|uniref:multicopper oxidase family protein n=1 Tax=methane-oxidizing endosymbiont of Gigantopelta aegis TaxID=2794938 RepID=UPI0018DC9592|nr:multicopper oxidase domain-containing protein [methane-oxidizing endosymbiont of Gigantopelta aegis]